MSNLNNEEDWDLDNTQNNNDNNNKDNNNNDKNLETTESLNTINDKEIIDIVNKSDDKLNDKETPTRSRSKDSSTSNTKKRTYSNNRSYQYNNRIDRFSDTNNDKIELLLDPNEQPLEQWLQRFNKFCERNDITNENKTDKLICSIRGAPLAALKNVDLGIAREFPDYVMSYMQKYTINLTNQNQHEIEFYTAKQYTCEPVKDYLTRLRTLGTKLRNPATEQQIFEKLKSSLNNEILTATICLNYNNMTEFINNAERIQEIKRIASQNNFKLNCRRCLANDHLYKDCPITNFEDRYTICKICKNQGHKSTRCLHKPRIHNKQI